MTTRKKTPLCSLETVFNHPDIVSICQRIDLIADLLDQYEDREPFQAKLKELAIELKNLITERAFAHMDHNAAHEFLANWDQLPDNHRFAALVSIHRQNIAAARQEGE